MNADVAATPAPRGQLVVGTGEAGLTVAITLRDLGYDGPITMVGDEPHLPYHRPPLSKGLLDGSAEPADVILRAPEFFGERGIEVRTGARVQRITLGDDGGGSAVLDDGSHLGFDGLTLATGSVARILPVPGVEFAGVHTVRTLDDAVALHAALDEAIEVVVVGGGFIGLEVAATARRRGAAVTVVEASDRILGRVVAPEVSEFIGRHHQAAGIVLRTRSGVAALTGDGDRVRGVVLDDGSELSADLVVVGVGAVPVTGLAEELGLRCERGIVVDAESRTTHPSVMAAGDCTAQPHPHGEGLLTIESVNNAAEQGRAAAHTLLGRTAPQHGVPWFWSTQGDLRLQIVGISDGYDAYVVRTESDSDRLTVLYYRDDRLIAVDTVNNPRDHMAAKKALAAGATIDGARASDPGVALKELVLP